MGTWVAQLWPVFLDMLTCFLHILTNFKGVVLLEC